MSWNVSNIVRAFYGLDDVGLHCLHRLLWSKVLGQRITVDLDLPKSLHLYLPSMLL